MNENISRGYLRHIMYQGNKIYKLYLFEFTLHAFPKVPINDYVIKSTSFSFVFYLLGNVIFNVIISGHLN